MIWKLLNNNAHGHQFGRASHIVRRVEEVAGIRRRSRCLELTLVDGCRGLLSR